MELIAIVSAILQGAPGDSLELRRMAAAMLHLEGEAAQQVSIEERELSFFPGVQAFEASGSGFHEPNRALIVRLPSTQLVPAGCPQGRRVLVGAVTPEFAPDEVAEYAAVLALLDGAINGVGTVISNESQLPGWMLEWMTNAGVTVRPPEVRERPDEALEVTAMVLVKALFEITVYIGTSRLDDAVVETKLVVGYPPG